MKFWVEWPFAAFWKYPILRQTLEAPKVVEEGKQRPEVLILGSGQSEGLEDDEIQDEDQDEDPDQDKDQDEDQDQDEDPDQDKDQDEDQYQDEDQDEDTDQDEDKDQDAGRSEEFLESVWFYEFWRWSCFDYILGSVSVSCPWVYSLSPLIHPQPIMAQSSNDEHSFLSKEAFFAHSLVDGRVRSYCNSHALQKPLVLDLVKSSFKRFFLRQLDELADVGTCGNRWTWYRRIWSPEKDCKWFGLVFGLL